MVPPSPPNLVIDEETVLETCGECEYPQVGTIEQVWETDPIPPDTLAAVAAEEVGSFALDSVPDGGTVAVGAGSRGITNIDQIVRGTVEGLADRGYDPFVFPAMGSHGGATAETQREKLESYGITEARIGCEIRATMAVEQVGRTPERDVPVYADANAVAADTIVPVNRVKPHPSFRADVESGLSKMLVIGMGKQQGAKMTHRQAHDAGLADMIPEIASFLLDRLPVAGGMAVVEDQHYETAIVEGLPPSGFLTRESELLAEAYDRMAVIPFDHLDALVVDRMGKDVSGGGMDPHVLGAAPGGHDTEVERVYTRALTDATKGNGVGINQANFVHHDLYYDLDVEKSVINSLTAGGGTVAVPTVVETDRAGLHAALSTVGVVDPGDVRMARITDTQRLSRLYASEALIEVARDRDDLRVVSEPAPIEFEGGAFAAPSPAVVE